MNSFRRPTPAIHGYRRAPALTIRWAGPSDAARLRTLAELDSAPVPAPPLLLAFVGEELWAARSLSTGVHISDPFRPSAELTGFLAERGAQLTVPQRHRWFRRILRRDRGAAPAGAMGPLSREAI